MEICEMNMSDVWNELLLNFYTNTAG